MSVEDILQLTNYFGQSDEQFEPIYSGRPYTQDQLEAEHRQESARARADPKMISEDVQREVRKLVVREEAMRIVAESRADDGEGWAPESLTDAEPLPPPTVLEIGEGSGDFLIRLLQIALVHGAFGSGKTPLCYIALVGQVKAGHLVLIADYEMGRSAAVFLLRALGLSDREIDEGVYYRYGPPPMSSTGRQRLVEEIDARQRSTGRTLTAVLIDSLTEAMATMPGSSDNDAQDVTTWFDSMPKWMLDQFGAAVIVIDHSGVVDGPRPSGSHKKQEAVQFHLWVRKGVPFSKSHDNGSSMILVQKDRSGEREVNKPVAELRTRLHGSFYVQPIAPAIAPDGTVTLRLDQQPDRSTDDDVLADLRGAGRDGIMKTTLTGHGEAGKYRRAALLRLDADGKAVSRPKPRTTGRLWYAVEFAP